MRWSLRPDAVGQVRRRHVEREALRQQPPARAEALRLGAALGAGRFGEGRGRARRLPQRGERGAAARVGQFAAEVHLQREPVADAQQPARGERRALGAQLAVALVARAGPVELQGAEQPVRERARDAGCDLRLQQARARVLGGARAASRHSTAGGRRSPGAAAARPRRPTARRRRPPGTPAAPARTRTARRRTAAPRSLLARTSTLTRP